MMLILPISASNENQFQAVTVAIGVNLMNYYQRMNTNYHE